LLEYRRIVPARGPASFRISVGKNTDSLSCEGLILAKNFVALFTIAKVSVQFGRFQGGEVARSGQGTELLIFIMLAAPGMNL
jgi:hypothetical protein